MTTRLVPFGAAPDTIAAMQNLEDHLRHCGLEYSLIELVKTRASQINGCAFCIHMHTTDARNAGEREMRLYLLSSWRESSLYTERERAALAWTETLTRVAETQAPDEDYQALTQQFTEKEMVELTFIIGAINTWNRLAVGFRLPHPASGLDKTA